MELELELEMVLVLELLLVLLECRCNLQKAGTLQLLKQHLAQHGRAFSNSFHQAESPCPLPLLLPFVAFSAIGCWQLV